MYGALFSSNSSNIGNSANVISSSPKGALGAVDGQQTSEGTTYDTRSSRSGTSNMREAISHNESDTIQTRPAQPLPVGSASAHLESQPVAASQNGLSSGVDAEAIWQAARSQLAMQMPTATYDTWMRDTKVVAYEDGEFIIGIPNAYVRDWLENRLRTKIKKTLSTLLGRSVQVNFRVVPAKAPNEPARPFAPLYEQSVDGGRATSAANSERHTKFDYAQMGDESLRSTENSLPKPQARRADDAVAGHPEQGQNSHAQTQPAADSSAEASYLISESISENSSEESRTVGDWRGTMHSPGMLNPAHTFDNLVVGNHNRLAHAAAQAIAEAPGQSFNPLFIYGGVGLGKTHLLHAVSNQARQRGFRLLYCSSEQFTHELIMAIRSQSTEDFRNKYRQVDMLLIDDIQFISGKESTQEEFFHTFNYLHAAGRQVVLSSDRPPKALGTLDDRLRSRFEGGLQTDISQPDFETRVAILQSKALKTDLRIHRDVLMLIAERVESNVRELEGVLNRMVLQARLFSSSLDLALAENILRNLAPQRTPRSPSIVIRVVADYYHLQPIDLTGRTRTKDIAHARQVAMYLLREENGLSLPAIGDHLGGRDHSTVRYGVDKIASDLDGDETLRREVVTLREKIYMEPGF